MIAYAAHTWLNDNRASEGVARLVPTLPQSTVDGCVRLNIGIGRDPRHFAGGCTTAQNVIPA